ncbi:MAG: DUF2341 domain-containing protein [Candidatus Thorarchaeota archaeon]
MRKCRLLTLVLVALFLFSFIDLSGNSSIATNQEQTPSNQIQVSESGASYTGTGSPLTVYFSGTFINSSTWSISSNTLSNLLTPGTSFSVENATLVIWTTYVLVSPPPEVETLSFGVDYPLADWKPISVIDPLGVAKIESVDWYYEAGILTVDSLAIATHGLWKLEFLASNHVENLLLGPSGQPLEITETFDTGSTIDFQVTSSWITGASAELTLIDPTGSEWYSATNTTIQPTTHLVSSFEHRKDFTINGAYVYGDKTNFPVLIDILDTDLHTDVQPTGNDILFVSGNKVLSHEIELFVQNYDATRAQLVAWVKANLSDTGSTIITMYYGNPDVESQEDPSGVWSNSYSATWHLGEDVVDEQTTGIHHDSTAADYYGNQDGNLDVPGIFGYGQRFYKDDQIVVSYLRGLEPSGDVTISGWFRLDTAHSSTSKTQTILTKAINGDTDMHIALKGSDYSGGGTGGFGSLVFKVENSNQRVYTYSTRTSWSANVWYYFAITMYAGNPQLNKIYINGADNTASHVDVGTWADLSFIDDWVIGGGFNDQLVPTTGHFNGTIDEVRISNTIRDSNYILTEWSNWNFKSLFIVKGSEVNQQSPELSFSVPLDNSAPAGIWTATINYNDTGISVSHRVGKYSRNFIVQRESLLSVTSPSDAASGLASLTVGDLLYLVVDLEDSITSQPITGATVSMNWSISGVETNVNFEDLGDGRYSVARNTSQLSTRQRWHIDVQASHPFYIDDTASFDLDLYHPTQLTYEWVTSTPVGFDFTTTLVFRDTWDGSLISGATITLGDGTPVTAVPWGNGRYNVTMNTSAYPKGMYWFMFNATNPSSLYEMASVNVTCVIRPHYTALSVSGNLVTPFGADTTLNVVFVDLDTGLRLDATTVSSLIFTSSYGIQTMNSPVSLNNRILDTDLWFVGITSVNLSVVVSNSNYYTPDVYTFEIEIRNHKTAVYVTGNLTTPYGADTAITVVLTDLDGGTINIGSISSLTFTSAQGVQVNSSLSSFTLNLKTNDWPVSTIQVTLSVVLSGNYDNPTNYVFSVVIHSLRTTLYNAPSDLLFPIDTDFTIVLHLNVSETGQYYGYAIDGQAGQYTVTRGATTYVTTITPLGNGMYQLTIAWSYFDGQGTDFTINIAVTPNDNRFAPTSTLISFQYREAISDLTANLYTVSTPYNMDVSIHLYYRDLDRDAGIASATISANPAIINSQSYLGNGDYLIGLDVSGFSIGSNTVNLTASAAGYNTRWLIITIIITKIHTDAEPTTIRLEIPSGNSKIFYIEWTDLDNGIPLQALTINHNWTGGIAPIFSWTGTRYQVTFSTNPTDLLGVYLVWFNFTIDNRYENGYCEIQIEIRSHETILTAETPPPTAIDALVNITVYFYDFDNKVGIDSALVNEEVFEDANPISSILINSGNGYYIIQIEAGSIGLGLHYFTISLNWTGAVQQYEDNTVYVSVNIIGVDSQMVLLSASSPSQYLDIMSYVFVYNEKDSGIGITNVTGNVIITVSFNVPFDMSKLTITEVNRILNPGRYSIVLNSSGFNYVGQFSMTINIDWIGGDPFYNDRSDTVSVRVLARDTVLLINPPSPVSYGENATFSFTWEDTDLGSNILDSAELLISLNATHDPIIHSAGLFTLNIDTSQFADMGSYSLILTVTWTGEPFYTNRTSTIRLTLLARQTVLDYPTPDPTFYSDNVTITVTWTDVTGGGSVPVTAATVSVYEDAVLIPSNEYSMTELPGGVYEIEFSTSRFPQPGLVAIEVRVHVPASYIADKTVTRYLDVRERRTILSYEAIGNVAYGDPIVFTMYFEDLYTSQPIGNASGIVTLDILTAGLWTYSSLWNGVDEYYTLIITSYPVFNIGEAINIQLRMDYAYQTPFYAPDDLTISFQLRSRLSLLSIEEAPIPTPYLDWSNFTVRYLDVDGNYGISADYFEVYYGLEQLASGQDADYFYSSLGSGFYAFSVNSTIFGVLGVDSIRIDAFWISGPDYHNNASRTINIRVTTRDTILDLIVPPTQTRYLNNMTLTFRYLDLFRNTAITSISPSQITIFNNGATLSSGDFILTSIGDMFRISINSTILGSVLGTYNVTVLVEWAGGEPYYVDASVESFVTTTNRLMSFSASPIEEAPFGDLLNISFRLTDSGRGWLIDLSHVTLNFDAQSPTITLVQGVDFWVYLNVPSIGMFTIRVDTASLLTPGTVLFDLYVIWNPAEQPYYANMAKTVLEGVVGDLETELTPWPDAYVEVGWKAFADINVDYSSFLYGNLTSGATVTWRWFGGEGSSSEIGLTGRYFAQLNTTLVNAGTYIVTIEAVRDNYALARTYVTLVITPLPSVIQVISPVGEEQVIPRGSPVSITVYLEDSTFGVPIDSVYVNKIECTFQSVVYTLLWNTTNGFYKGLIPAGSPTDLPEGSYAILVRAEFRNYAPATFVININTIQSRTALALTSGTEEDMSAEFTQIVIFTVNLTTPDFNNSLFSQADVSWVIDEGGWSGDFTLIGPGLFEAIVNTVDLGYGIWPVSIKAHMWDNVTLFSDSIIQLTLTITRIETTVIRPSNIEVAWGWSGELTFTYNGTYGPISGATASFTGNLIVGAPVDNGDGTYTIFVDTTREYPGVFSINVVFLKPNYQEAPAVVQFTVREVRTAIYPYSVEYDPIYVGTVANFYNLQIPIGDSMIIDFFFNDTDADNDYWGGLSGAYATINSYLRGPSIDGTLNVSVIDLGYGKYRVIFDTLDPNILAIVDDIDLYSFYIQMKLENHTAADVIFKIEVINVETSFEILNAPQDWTIQNGAEYVLELRYFDTWHGVGIAGATIHANVSRGAPFSVRTSAGATPGTYYVELITGQILFSDGFGTLTITIDKDTYSVGSESNILTILRNPRDETLTLVITYGLPGLLIVAMLSIGYIRVWSVPKQLRRINSQIKAIRKGKIPKPVKDARSRQQIITDLFNDTYEKVEIVRPIDAFPEESVPVEVPELGELLIQLSILTNLNQQELDDFKADIAKMKMSEQAAFVKEVIMQEAIRAARREGNTVEETISQIQKEAAMRLAGQENRQPSADIVEELEEPEEEPVFLTPRKKEPEPEDVEISEKPTGKVEDFSFSSDQLSPFEIEELRKDLIQKGVPLAEIDIIIKQAQELPRDLVEELVRSLEAERLRKG